ncbi:unnamed protein product [Caenorhabditis auriculariae]|uniref:Pyrrolo-quinoline quinone repeat domain-containing protein n=1 Tax=Caenorhabditis auriculariae TaxID=2777116 RepID=A0A8S1H607_9PELO|nr:unnamed protein product [Caenorhabditis auriculariae]
MKWTTLYTTIVIAFLISFSSANDDFNSELHSTYEEEPGSISTVLVSTIDGHLRALDSKNGRILWTIREDAVLRSPSTVKQGFTYLPNPIDGSLYLLKDSSLKKLPFNIPQLVHASPCRGNDGVLYAGSKKDVWFGIDPLTGTKVETLSSSSADRICPANKGSAVFVGRTEYRVSMFDGSNRARTWNVTYNDYSAHLLPENSNYKLRHYVSTSSGNILAVDSVTAEIRWEQDLKEQIVAIYLLQNDGLHKLPFEVLGRETLENSIKISLIFLFEDQ